MSNADKFTPKSDAETVAAEAAATLRPELFAPRIRRMTDEIYETLMTDVQEYLKENVRWNIGQRIREADNRTLLARQQIADIAEALGWRGAGMDWMLGRVAELKRAEEAAKHRHDNTAELLEALEACFEALTYIEETGTEFDRTIEDARDEARAAIQKASPQPSGALSKEGVE